MVRHRRESGDGPVKPGSLLRVAGFSAVSALFQRAPERVVRLFYDERQARQVGEFCARMAQLRRPYRKVDADELTKIAGTVLHGGVVAVAEPQSEQPLTVAECKRLLNSGTTLFVLDGIGNPHNVGAIARSLAMEPKVMLFDEPTSALDPELVQDVLGTMKQLASEGWTMVVVTHEINFARDVADHVVLIEDGHIVEEGSAKQLFEDSTHPRTQAFLQRIQL